MHHLTLRGTERELVEDALEPLDVVTVVLWGWDKEGWLAKLGPPRDNRWDLHRNFLRFQAVQLDGESTGGRRVFHLYQDGLYEADSLGERHYFVVQHRRVHAFLNDKEAAKRHLMLRKTKSDQPGPLRVKGVALRKARWI